MKIPPYNSQDWAEIYKYVSEWNKQRPRDSPSHTDYQVYNVALAAALLKNAESMEKLTKAMLRFTVIIVILTAVMVAKLFW